MSLSDLEVQMAFFSQPDRHRVYIEKQVERFIETNRHSLNPSEVRLLAELRLSLKGPLLLEKQA